MTPWLRLQRWLCMGMATVVVAAALGLTGGVAHAQQAIDPLPFKDRAQEVRFQKLAGQLRCLVCQDESLLESNADLAQQMRQIVFQKMQQGWSDQKIKHYFVERYSDYVLYKPPFRPSTWLLWLGPLAILLAGAAVVTVTVRKRRADAAHVEPELDDDEW